MYRRECPGVVMLSEFTSCMRVLRGAVRINPWKVDEVAAAMIMVLVSAYCSTSPSCCSSSHLLYNRISKMTHAA
jgi:trehalose-6-phosphate synthase